MPLSVYWKMWEYYSASRINCFNYCRRRGFLAYVLHDKQLNPSSYLRGSLVHELIEKFWERLGTPDEVKSKYMQTKTGKRYSNADEFIDFGKRQWMYYVMREERAGREIVWKRGDNNEMWNIRNFYMPLVCKKLFPRIIEEGKPVFAEMNFDFILGNRRFTGFIDDLRIQNGDIIVRDYKTEKAYKLKDNSMKLGGNPQLTLYSAAVCALIKKDKLFAEKLGINNIDDFMHGARFISQRVKPELYMVDAFFGIEERENLAREISVLESNIPRTEEALAYHSMLIDEKKSRLKRLGEAHKIIQSTTRSDKDLYEMLEFLDDIDNDVRNFGDGIDKKIPPTERGIKCDECDQRVSCLKRLEETLNDSGGDFKDRAGQLHFGFVSHYEHKDKSTRKKKTRRLFK